MGLQNRYRIRSVKEGLLYTSARPGRERGRGVIPPKDDVDQWVEEATSIGIRSIICLLEDRSQLHRYYDPLNLHPWGLLGHYYAHGFRVFFFHTTDYQRVPVTVKKQALAAFNGAPKPVLLQDSGGVDRTSEVARYILQDKEFVF